MGAFQNYPYTDVHQLNLDWVIKEVKNIKDREDSIDEAVESSKNYAEEAQESAEQASESLSTFTRQLSDWETEKDNIEEQLDRNTQNITIQTSRIDEIISGTTPDANAELIDIRVGANGEVYPTAGDAVRGQIIDIEEDLNDICINNTLFKSDLETVTGTGTYVYKNIDVTDGIVTDQVYTLKIGRIVGGTSPHLAYLRILGVNDQVLQNVSIGSVTENASASIVATAETVKIRISLYPATTTPLPTGEATYSDVILLKGTQLVKGVPWEAVLNDRHIRYVGTNCTYTTIQSAIDDSEDGDTIIILPGVYDEAVSVSGSTGDVHTSGKNLRIVGLNRDKCILTHDIGDYYSPPLEISMGCVENLTIRGTGTSLSEGSNQFAYAVHIDYNSSIGQALQFKNCNFENTVYPSVGIGLRENFKLSFDNCNFSADNSASVLFHEQQGASNITGQSIEFNNCSMISGSSYTTIQVQESGSITGDEVEVTFMRNIVKNTSTGQLARRVVYPAGDSSQGEGWLGTRIYHLKPTSDLNSDDLFNY